MKRQLKYSRQYILKAEEERDEAQRALVMAKQEIVQMSERYESQNRKANPIFVSTTASSSSMNHRSDDWIAGGNTNPEKLENEVMTFTNDRGQYVNSRNNSNVGFILM